MQRSDELEEINFARLNEIAFYKNATRYNQLITRFAQEIINNSREMFSGIDIKKWIEAGDEETNDNMSKYCNDFLFCVVFDVLQYDTPILRMLAIEKWIAIMQTCFDAQDFSSAQLIYSALYSGELDRLRHVISDISQERFNHIGALFFGNRDTKQISVEMSMAGCVPSLMEQIRQTKMAQESGGSEEFIGQKVVLLESLQESIKTLFPASKKSKTASDKKEVSWNNLLWELPTQQPRITKKGKAKEAEKFKKAKRKELKDSEFEITRLWIIDFYVNIKELYCCEYSKEEGSREEKTSNEEETSSKEKKITWDNLLWRISKRRQAKGVQPDPREKEKMIQLSKKINKVHQQIKRNSTGIQAFFYDFEKKLFELHQILLEIAKSNLIGRDAEKDADKDVEKDVGKDVKDILGKLAKLAGIEERRQVIFKGLTPYRVEKVHLLEENDLLRKLNELHEILYAYVVSTDKYSTPKPPTIPVVQEGSSSYLKMRGTLAKGSDSFTTVPKKKDGQDKTNGKSGDHTGTALAPDIIIRATDEEQDGLPKSNSGFFRRSMAVLYAALDNDDDLMTKGKGNKFLSNKYDRSQYDDSRRVGGLLLPTKKK